NNIDCQEFIARFQVVYKKVKEEKDSKWLRDATREVADVIHKKKLNIKEAFKTFDRDKSGGVSYDEFCEALNSLGLNYTKKQAYKLAEYVDKNSSKNISRREFRRAFRIVDTKDDVWQDEV